MTPLKFEGEPPFALPAVQSASAVARDEIVEMTLRVLVEGRLTTVYARMSHQVADGFATQLPEAAQTAHMNKWKG
jgi:hypothetical protein